MRDIKFRAWDKNRKGFINGFNMIGFSTGQGAPYRKLARFSDQWKEEDFELMQFTGMYEKFGAYDPKDWGEEIWESDIIEFEEDLPNGDHVFHRGIVTYHLKTCTWVVLKTEHQLIKQSLNHVIKLMRGRKIGNIYENPELLK